MKMIIGLSFLFLLSSFAFARSSVSPTFKIATEILQSKKIVSILEQNPRCEFLSLVNDGIGGNVLGYVLKVKCFKNMMEYDPREESGVEEKCLNISYITGIPGERTQGVILSEDAELEACK